MQKHWEIGGKNEKIFDQNLFFAISKIFELGKSLKLPKMQFYEKKLDLFDFTSFFKSKKKAFHGYGKNKNEWMKLLYGLLYCKQQQQHYTDSTAASCPKTLNSIRYSLFYGPGLFFMGLHHEVNLT